MPIPTTHEPKTRIQQRVAVYIIQYTTCNVMHDTYTDTLHITCSCRCDIIFVTGQNDGQRQN